MSTELDERTEVDVTITEDGDHDKFSHYASKVAVMESAMTGNPVVALCGKVWVPGRDPKKFTVCPSCKEIYESMKE